jgi:cell division protease FtsH
VTIIPRGRALGVTASLPVEDKHNRSRTEFMNDIAILLGGRAAEELILKEVTTGASNDLERATNLSHRMICEFGMNDRLGPRTFGRKDREIFLGRDFARERNYSEETAEAIDEEIRKIITESYGRTMTLLKKNRDRLTRLADALLEREVLDGDEVDRILRGGRAAAGAPVGLTPAMARSSAKPG